MLQVFRAYDRNALAEVATDDTNALEAKLATASRIFADRGGWLKPHQRIDILRRLAVLLKAKREEFARLIAQEGGKPLTDALVEADRAVDGVRDAAGELHNFGGREISMGLTPASVGRWAFTTKEPIGVVVAISAFNHPLNLIVHQVVPAIAVGCPVIVKPATPTPLCCLEFVRLVHEAGLPEPWCQTFVTEDNALAERLVVDARVAFLSFIGSAGVGWYLRSKLPPGTRCALEHGGAAPVIVDRSADIEAVVGPLARGGYYHAGQVCVSTQRIFVHADLRAAFEERFAAEVGVLRTGDPLDPATQVGPLIQPREVNRVLSWLEEARAGGARLALGGERLSETTLQPSILLDPPPDAKISRQEVFGPVTAVYSFTELDDAIEAANRLPVAFQASVFSRELAPALHVAERLDVSAVMINDHTAFRTDWMPFAGRRQSGLGVGGIPWTMRELAEEKMVVLRHS
jgi:acyl-CoA reductase-like NAD-dependent aldehyde dehydrogenase